MDSIGSRPQWAAGRAVQAEDNDRRWRPVSEKQIDGIWTTTCALCGKVKKRARGKQIGVAVAVGSTLRSVAAVGSELAG